MYGFCDGYTKNRESTGTRISKRIKENRKQLICSCKSKKEKFSLISEDLIQNMNFKSVSKNNVKYTIDGQIECENCKIKFTTIGNLNKHLMKRGCIEYLIGKRKKPFECDLCFAKFKKVMRLKHHVKTEHNFVKPKYTAKCSVCEKIFKDNGGLKRHTQYIHEGKRDVCPICKEEFMGKANVEKHIAFVHEGIRPFLCTICGYKAVTKGEKKY